MSSPLLTVAAVLLLIGGRWAYARWKRARFMAQLQRGVEATKRRNAAEAESAFRACVRLAPSSPQVRLALGAALAQGQKFDEAEEQLRMAAQLEPKQPRGHLELGFFLALCAPDRPDEAVAAFRDALECEPKLKEGLAKDPRLAGLRENISFKELLQIP